MSNSKKLEPSEISVNLVKNSSITSESAHKNLSEYGENVITVSQDIKKNRKRKNSNKPKRPLSAYIYFSQEVRRFDELNNIDARSY